LAIMLKNARRKNMPSTIVHIPKIYTLSTNYLLNKTQFKT
jgi:hypothetical protein